MYLASVSYCILSGLLGYLITALNKIILELGALSTGNGQWQSLGFINPLHVHTEGLPILIKVRHPTGDRPVLLRSTTEGMKEVHVLMDPRRLDGLEVFLSSSGNLFRMGLEGWLRLHVRTHLFSSCSTQCLIFYIRLCVHHRPSGTFLGRGVSVCMFFGCLFTKWNLR
jgi:hypothetical protein